MLRGQGGAAVGVGGASRQEASAIHARNSSHAANSRLAAINDERLPCGRGAGAGPGEDRAACIATPPAVEAAAASAAGRPKGRGRRGAGQKGVSSSASGAENWIRCPNAEAKSKTSSKSSRRSSGVLRICPISIRLKTISPKSPVQETPQ